MAAAGAMLTAIFSYAADRSGLGGQDAIPLTALKCGGQGRS